MKLKNHVWRFPRRTKIADFRKNAEKWKHCISKDRFVHDPALLYHRVIIILIVRLSG